jgi:hypothetical protein
VVAKTGERPWQPWSIWDQGPDRALRRQYLIGMYGMEYSRRELCGQFCGWHMSTSSFLGSVIGVLLATALFLMISFRSIRLKVEASAQYSGAWRWLGERVETKYRALSFAAGLVFGMSIILTTLWVNGPS